MQFEIRLLDDVAYEAASVVDVDGDGVLDVVCGAHWYEGPTFETRHRMCDVEAAGEYYDDFSDYPLDVSGDGRPDIVTGGWWGETLRWREHPGGDGTGEWSVHDVEEIGNIETIRYCDVDGCGTVEVFPNTPNDPPAYYELHTDAAGTPTGGFDRYELHPEPSRHGLGFGDVTGNGRPDVLLADGWLEHPGDPTDTPWTFHGDWEFGMASVPILAHDVTGNGRTDLIVGQAHDYGLSWYEQVEDDGDGEWVEHVIDGENSQYHDLRLADLDGDGDPELVTGKRYRAHDGNDPGADDPLGLYYFDVEPDGSFTRHVIARGPPEDGGVGCGIYFWIEDLTGNGFPDVVAPGKDGLHLVENHGGGGTA